MKKRYLSISLLLLFQCSEKELLTPVNQPLSGAQIQTQPGTLQISAGNFYVSVTGSDAGDGTAARPWRTIRTAVGKMPVGQGYTLQLSTGVFVEDGRIQVPPGVHLTGAGAAQTIIKSAGSFYYHPVTPGYATDKFLISLASGSLSAGNQTLSGFTVEGDAKQLHGGIYVNNRSNVIITDVKVQNTNFSGIWLWDVKDSKLINTQLVNCSWGSTSYCAGALNLGNVDHLEIDRLNVDESTGYGIKAIGPGGNNNIINLLIHDSHISVHPYGLWNKGSAPNIAIELWQINLVNSEIYNTYLDNTLSLINSNATPSTGVPTIHVHHNTFDMETRAHGAGYGIELTIHDTEIDHNYFLKGTYGIANWDSPMKNWNIHHNTFFALQGIYPGEVLRSQWSGLHNVKFYNNTIEFTGNKTMNVIGIYGGTSDNLDVRNNLMINNNSGYSFYPNAFIHSENGATINVLTVKNNSFFRLPVGTVPGIYLNNLTSDPLLTNSGSRPDPYYIPSAASPVINTGVDVGYPYTGSAPDVGAWEYGGTTTTPPAGSARLNLDSSGASLTGQMTTGSDASAQSGNYFYVPVGSGRNYFIPPTGLATFNFQLTKTDNYVIWVKVKSPVASNQGYNIYNGKGRWFTWMAGTHATWTWVKITDGGSNALFAFIQGANQFQMGWFDENVQVDQILITNDLNYAP